MYTRRVIIKRIPEYLIRKMSVETFYENIVDGNFCQVFNAKRKVWEYWLISHEKNKVEAKLNDWKKKHKHEEIQRQLDKIMSE